MTVASLREQLAREQARAETAERFLAQLIEALGRASAPALAVAAAPAGVPAAEPPAWLAVITDEVRAVCKRYARTDAEYSANLALAKRWAQRGESEKAIVARMVRGEEVRT